MTPTRTKAESPTSSKGSQRMYHVAGHGKGRSAGDYTKDAMTFFEQNKSLGIPWTLKDGTPGIKIKIGKTGGYWTQDGRLVTFWD